MLLLSVGSLVSRALQMFCTKISTFCYHLLSQSSFGSEHLITPVGFPPGYTGSLPQLLVLLIMVGVSMVLIFIITFKLWRFIMTYPASIEAIVERTNGPSNVIDADHMNVIRTALNDLETILGALPQGDLASLTARLSLVCTDAGCLVPADQTVLVAKSGFTYTTIMAALASITDASVTKKYTIFVMPGEYDEAITLKDYVDIIALDPANTTVMQTVKDNSSTVRATLVFNISTEEEKGLYMNHVDSDIVFKGDINCTMEGGCCVWARAGTIVMYGNLFASEDAAIKAWGATITVYGNITGSGTVVATQASYPCTAKIFGTVMATTGMAASLGAGSLLLDGDITVTDELGFELYGGTLTLRNGLFKNNYNYEEAHGINKSGGTLLVQNERIVLTHASVKSFNASSAQDVYCYGVYSNRDDDSDIVQKIASGFTYDANTI